MKTTSFDKPNAMLQWDYAPITHKRPKAAIHAAAERLDGLRLTESDYEMALPVYELDSFARGEGYYAGVAPAIRTAQLDWMAQVHDRLYPGLRIFLFDARTVFSAPVTVFEPIMAVIYMGQHDPAFRDRVRAISRRFDGLVRDIPALLDRLKGAVA